MNLRAQIVGAAVADNSVKELSPHTANTGLRTTGLRHRTLDVSAQDRLAEVFLLNTRLRRDDVDTNLSIADYFTDEAMVMLSLNGERSQSAGSIPLPKPAPLRKKLDDALRERRSVRRFTGAGIELEMLAALLASAGGITGSTKAQLSDGSFREILFRAAPSGGGLYPVEFYVAAPRVKGLDAGSVYRYAPRHRSLVEMFNDRKRVDDLFGAFAVDENLINVSQCAAVIYLVATPWRSMRKYGPRGMRFVFMEAGYASQNVHLAATALGCGSTDCGAVYDDVHSALGLDGQFQALVHTIVIGMQAV